VCNTWVVPQNISFSPALTQQAHYEIHSQPAAPRGWLAERAQSWPSEYRARRWDRFLPPSLIMPRSLPHFSAVA
jgi:hypothetical protein